MFPNLLLKPLTALALFGSGLCTFIANGHDSPSSTRLAELDKHPGVKSHRAMTANADKRQTLELTESAGEGVNPTTITPPGVCST